MREYLDFKNAKKILKKGKENERKESTQRKWPILTCFAEFNFARRA